jgi:hypothetical protein
MACIEKMELEKICTVKWLDLGRSRCIVDSFVNLIHIFRVNRMNTLLVNNCHPKDIQSKGIVLDWSLVSSSSV